MTYAPDAAAELRRGTLAALAAFSIWGLMPLYFRAVGEVPPFEIVAHRVLWSLVFLAALIALVPGAGRFSAIGAVLRQPRLTALLALTASLTGSNWLVFVWSIDAGRLIEASLGYFINPLVSVLLGRLFLGERLRPLQTLAVGIAAAGVCWRIWQVGTLPWIALFLAATFGLYGLLRKRAPVDPIGGLFIETLVTAPIALLWLAWLDMHGELRFGSTLHLDLLLPLAGILTAIPLMLFAVGARRLPLATLGFLQYLAPSLNFLIAIMLFREPFDHGQLIGFLMIWTALAIYSADMLRHAAGQRRTQ
ncbi:EamA family transporter RarD [Azoarcus sp. L1K30]|uniref:EamA family transporter RarD n=1 Tax=Azoarcus sp. L1K30 TaxID=2820277 RepID=UPI001B82A909|nr:EamA family transporter RarD [Azoarcus sp. L1K30]MBR0567812.1 EamA family transporter RarD [Azoarcus sp. L1K30]